MGTSDSGHYYSFIRERRPNAADTSEKWFQFNDDRVTVTEVSDLARHFNGGPDVSAVDGRPLQFPKNYSAYMLFYDRMDVEAANTTVPDVEGSAMAMSSLSSSAAATASSDSVPSGCVENTFRHMLSRYAPHQIPRFLNAQHASLLLPSTIARACRQDNLVFWRSLLVLNPVHIQLTWRLITESLLQHCPPADVVVLPSGHHATLALRAAVMMTGHALYVMSDRATTLPDWTAQLSRVVSHHPALAGAFLSAVLADGVWLDRELVSNLIKKEREAISRLLVRTLESLARVESSSYLIYSATIGSKRAFVAGDGIDPASLPADVAVGGSTEAPKIQTVIGGATQSVIGGEDLMPLSGTEVMGSNDSTKVASAVDALVVGDDSAADVAPLKKQKTSLASSQAVSLSASQQVLVAPILLPSPVYSANSSRLLKLIVQKMDVTGFKLCAPLLVDIVWKFTQLGSAQRSLLLSLECLRVLPKVFLGQRSKIGQDGPLEVVLTLNALLNDINPSVETQFAIGNAAFVPHGSAMQGGPEEKVESDFKQASGEDSRLLFSDPTWQAALTTMSSPGNLVDDLLLHLYDASEIARLLCHVMHNDWPRTQAVCLSVEKFFQRVWDTKQDALNDNVLAVCWHLIRYSDDWHSQRATGLVKMCILKLMQQKVREWFAFVFTRCIGFMNSRECCFSRWDGCAPDSLFYQPH